MKVLTPFEDVTLQVSKEEASLSECIPYAHTLVSNITNIDTVGVLFPTFPIWLRVWPSQLTVYGNKNASFIQLCYFKYFYLNLHYIFVASIHRESSPPYWRGATCYWTGNVYSQVKSERYREWTYPEPGEHNCWTASRITNTRTRANKLIELVIPVSWYQCSWYTTLLGLPQRRMACFDTFGSIVSFLCAPSR